ncbi:S26 family signal peptidase [Streptomyces sp. NPDC001761]|uniref:S26 family signal peptidase n=1 Tax=Streptomyces spinosus TaxID=2872623 RepID=UPI001CED5DF2|nr:S26 family signal peptidase [Streptomyces spinosus]
MSPGSGPDVSRAQASWAETAPDRARVRARRARRTRTALLASDVALWAGSAVLLWPVHSPGWGAGCGAAALLLTAGLALARAAELRLVAVVVSGRSMEPAYHDGDGVLVRRGRTPVRGAAVVVERPPYQAPWPDPPVSRTAPAHRIYARQWFIKRVAAVPGDPVPRSALPALRDTPERAVPEGMLVLLGDNSEQSYDSRHVGYFPAERVLGEVAGPDQPARRMRNS